MKKNLKIFFLSVLMISCGGGGGDGDSGGGDPPPAPTPPGNPSLTSPANNTVCETGTSISDTQSNVVFSWQASSATDSYDLEVKNLDTNSIQNITGITTTTSTIALDKGEPYSWKVISKNNTSNQTGSSTTWKFYLAGIGTKNYEGSDPDQGDQLNYTLYLDKTDGKQTPSSDLTDLNVKTISVSVDGSTTYYWRVKTSDGTNSSFSNIYSFKTE